uniref:Disease resistance protein RGA3 n=1 Tax=Salix viminalis TaxID=40686 RepID=A0A6N2M307_SALVM
MADAIVSALVSTIMGNLNSSILQELGLAGGLETELENLKRTFRTIQAVLQDAEVKQWKDEATKVWLRHLKDVAYDVDDLLDEFAIEAQWQQQRRGLKNELRSFFSISHNPLVFPSRMAHKLKNMREKLDVIANEKNTFGLASGGVGDIAADHTYDWRLTGSIVNESEILGRGKEKEELVNILLTNGGDLSIHAMWGMGGLGKTTLAQLVYNEERVKQHFDLRIWVCVSTDFHLIGLTRAIIESIDGASCGLEELDPLQQSLQQKLTGKKFLLVLDDVWDDCGDSWSKLKEMLRCGAKGSVVLVTTRIEMVARRMATTFVHHIRELSEEDSRHLFQRLALGMRRKEEQIQLEDIGVSIAQKCGGVPLAIKALGNLMRLKDGEDEWMAVKKSEIWDLTEEAGGILPALRLSYTNLTTFEAVLCILLYISQRSRDDEGGAGCFVDGKWLYWLQKRNGFASQGSFLQEVQDDGFGNITCKMHDLMHDLAQSIAVQECYNNEGHEESEVPRTARHVKFGYSRLASPKEKILNVHSLRTCLSVDYDWIQKR